MSSRLTEKGEKRVAHEGAGACSKWGPVPKEAELTVGVDGFPEGLPPGKDEGHDEAVDGDQGPQSGALVAQHPVVRLRGVGCTVAKDGGESLVG